MNVKRLFYCVTPLNLLVADAIRRVSFGEDTIIYVPTSDSPKHRYYFDRAVAHRKIFVELPRYRKPDIFAQHQITRTIYHRVATRHFDQLLYACIGSIPFSTIATLHHDAEIVTFDDGLLHLDDNLLKSWIANEPLSHKVYRRLMGLERVHQTIARSTTHYTIFSEKIFSKQSNIHGHNVVRVPLFSSPEATGDLQKLSVLLGTPEPEEVLGISDTDYVQLLDAFSFDIYIPHPQEARPAYIAADLCHWADIKRAVEEFIAEDVALELIRLGYRPQVAGFGSTALLTLASAFDTTNYHSCRYPPSTVFQELGVTLRTIEELKKPLQS